MKDTLYFRLHHAGNQVSAEIDQPMTDKEEMQRLLDAIQVLMKCECCAPAYRGVDGEELDASTSMSEG